MISHFSVFGSILVGIPQGVYFAVQISKALKVGQPIEICMVLLGCFLGIFLGYLEILTIERLLGRKK